MIDHNKSHQISSKLIHLLLENDITDFFIAPGMRNAPLITSLNYYKTKIHSFYDERALSYMALGHSKETKKPSVLICTSGTALSNFLPAVIESYKSKAPLIILSADRPKKLVQENANQTISQTEIFNDFSHSKLLIEDTLDFDNELLEIISQTKKLRIPAHINLALDEPLDFTKEESISFSGQAHFYTLINESPNFSSISPNQIIEKLKNGENSLLAIGPLPSTINQDLLRNFLEKSKIPFFLDITSNLKYEFNLNDLSIPTFDHPEVQRVLKSSSLKEVIHIGGTLTSKHFYQLIKEKGFDYFNIDQQGSQRYIDVLGNDITYTDLNAFFGDLAELHYGFDSSNLNFKDQWTEFIAKKSTIIDDAKLSYPVLSKKLIENLSQESKVFIGNSTPIRSFDSYSSSHLRKKLDIFSNRGASGIEGLVSTSAGISLASDKPVYSIIGDISFFHDLNSLSLLKQFSPKLCLIIANNKGGGIFSLLPIAENKETLEVITTPHDYNIEAIVKSFGLNYKKIETTDDLSNLTSEEVQAPLVAEVIIDNDDNIELYKKLRTIRI